MHVNKKIELLLKKQHLIALQLWGVKNISYIPFSLSAASDVAYMRNACMGSKGVPPLYKWGRGMCTLLTSRRDKKEI